MDASVGEAEQLNTDAPAAIKPSIKRHNRKARNKTASPEQHVGAPPWLPLAVVAAAGVGLAAAARTLLSLHRRRSRRAQHERAFVQRFHMEASSPASTLLADARLVVDAGYASRALIPMPTPAQAGGQRSL